MRGISESRGQDRKNMCHELNHLYSMTRNAPSYIQLYPTLRCNKSCGFCFNRGIEPLPDMTRGDFQRVLGTLCLLGVEAIDIIGGEPTLHPEIMNIVNDACNAGIRINLSSNGTNIQILDEIMSCTYASIGVSINDENDLRAAALSRHRSKLILKSVFRMGIDFGFVDKMLSLGFGRYYLIYMDALNLPDLDQSLPFDDFISRTACLTGTGQAGLVYCSGFLPDTRHYPELSGVRCLAETTKLGIMPDGSVYPCNLFFNRKEFRLGNILSDPFGEIWADPRLKFFRTFNGNTCSRTSCTLHSSCHGGCPAHALLFVKDIAGPNIRCTAQGRGI